MLENFQVLESTRKSLKVKNAQAKHKTDSKVSDAS